MDTPTLTPADTHAHRAARFDIYAGIHKALRLMMSRTLTRVGATDPTAADEVAGTLDQVGRLLDLCELHLKDENEFIHPALERAQPGSAARIAAEHVHHVEAIADLRDLAGLVAKRRDAAQWRTRSGVVPAPARWRAGAAGAAASSSGASAHWMKPRASAANCVPSVTSASSSSHEKCMSCALSTNSTPSSWPALAIGTASWLPGSGSPGSGISRSSRPPDRPSRIARP